MMNVTYLDDGIWVVAPHGRVDSAGARTLEDELNNLFNDHNWRIVIDFTDVSYMSSAGLRVLMVGLRKVQGMGGLMCLASVSNTVLELVKMSGLDQIFEFYPTVVGAAERMKRLGK